MARVEIAVPPKLRPVFLGKARYRGAWGGRGSAKTRTFAKMMAVDGYRFGMAGREGVLLCAREFQNSLDESSMQEVKLAIASEPFLKAYYEIGESYIRSRDGRVKFSFKGLRHNIDSIKSMAGILRAWIDEAENVGEASWRKLIPTVREPDSEIWVTWNPASKHSATHKRFRLAPPTDGKIVEINWTDNPWFPAELERERLDDLEKRPEAYEHIWEGGFEVFADGAYWIRQMLAAAQSGRIGDVKPEPAFQVHTAWDLGIGDSTAIWVWQPAPGGIRVLDYIEDHGEPLAHYVAKLEALGHDYGFDFVPHDAKARELGTGRTRVETLDILGRKPRLVPMHTVEDGINAAREVIPMCWFSEGCDSGLDALREFRTEWVEDKGVFRPRPLHNWASHGADAFRYMAMAYRELRAPKKPDKKTPPPGHVKLPGPPEPKRGTRIHL